MDSWALFSVGLVLGLVVGAVLVLAVRRASPDAATAEVRRLTDLLGRAQDEAARGAGLAQRLEAEREGYERQIGAEREAFVRQLAAAERSADERLDAARAAHEQQLEDLRRASERRVAEVTGDHRRLEAQFEALSQRALAATSEQFLVHAEERLRRSHETGAAELAKREQAVRTLVEPLSRTLEQMRTEVAAAEKARAAGHSALSEHLRQLSEASAELRTGTHDLVTALRSSQTRGAWGELQLRRVVEAAGMLSRVDFTEQAHVTTEDGALRPDMVVHLAGGKNVVVDSKVAFLGYLEAQQATDATVREARLDAHVRHMVKHVDDLASKRYWSQFSPTPEFVVMFVPAEPFLAAAVERRPDLLEYAMRSNVIVATPMTLVALLRTVAYAWQQEAVTDNAHEVLRAGKELHSRLVTTARHVTKLGRSLSTATKDFNVFVGSLETRVLPQARRMVDLDVVDESERIERVRVVEEVPRPLTQPELVAAAADAVVAIDDRSSDDDREDPQQAFA
ncbi:DNA recombination protein RmuC [Cellulosimicrobium marinum]|uniref:DNA recombination protein RmuC n=1 Tax=Cellulosimicrobium marinum TaxID=1638992 RepID=UPI001E5E12B8|nr:DNA recombination protein RmuC [Cellulosimicrobium marinum]MCB7136541.1 DNA recombination protein RmuC [Cellulosimicrobium marinum]